MDDENILGSLFSNTVKMPDGVELSGDFYEVMTIVDLFASEYGLGGCRSIDEFIEMVDNMDPLNVRFLIKAIEDRYEQMYGSGKGSGFKANVSSKLEKQAKSSRGFKATDISKDDSRNRKHMAGFLKMMGADRGKVDEAIKKIESGEIKLSRRDYSWITPKEISKPDFDLKSTLKQMKEDRKKGVNFKVSLETLLGRG